MRISDLSSDVCSSDLRWRVKTWDSSDVESPWSEYGFFTTSASGVVNITDPAIDNDPDIVTANYLIMWDVTGTTQQDYKVVVTRKIGRASCRERVCQYL